MNVRDAFYEILRPRDHHDLREPRLERAAAVALEEVADAATATGQRSVAARPPRHPTRYIS
jgi:hypothetical protein